jgi:hypothetical protein
MMLPILRDEIILNLHNAMYDGRLCLHEDKGPHPVTDANNLVGPQLVDVAVAYEKAFNKVTLTA